MCTDVPTSLIKKNPFSIKLTLFILNNRFTLFVWLHFWAPNSVPLIYLSTLWPTAQSPDYCNFIVSLEGSSCQSSRVLFSLRYCVGSSGCFPSLYKLQTQFFNIHKWACWDLDCDCVKSIDQVGRNWSLDKIMSAPIYNLFRSFFFLFIRIL